MCRARVCGLVVGLLPGVDHAVTQETHRWPKSPESFICTCVNSRQPTAGLLLSEKHWENMDKILCHKLRRFIFAGIFIFY